MAPHRTHVLAGAAVVSGVAITALLVVSLGSGASSSKQETATTIHSSTPNKSVPASRVDPWNPVSPSTTVPTLTAIQQQYDQGFQRGFTSAANRQTIAATESLVLPSPATTGGWPALAPTGSPETWTREFIAGLLDVDFAHQSRRDLGSWLVAQEAPDLMPGVPAKAQLPSLYATVMAPQATDSPSPVPSPKRWQEYATSKVRWSVSGVQIQPNPQWQSMIAAGWQPADLYAAVEDVSGVLHISQAGTTSTKTFSLIVQLGSAHWHHGYGAALVSGWKES